MGIQIEIELNYAVSPLLGNIHHISNAQESQVIIIFLNSTDLGS